MASHNVGLPGIERMLANRIALGVEGEADSEVEVEGAGVVFVDGWDSGAVVEVVAYSGFGEYADVWGWVYLNACGSICRPLEWFLCLLSKIIKRKSLRYGFGFEPVAYAFFSGDACRKIYVDELP